MAEKVEYIISAKDLLTGTIQKTRNATKGLDNDIKKIHGSLGGLTGMLGGLVSIYGAFNFMKDSVMQFNAEAQELAGIQQILINTKGSAGQTSEALVAMAKAGQQTTTWADEQILASEKLLLSFTQIRGGIYTRAIPAIQDMASFLKVDLSTATETVGKALNNPIRGLMLLGRQGFAFTDKQKDMVEQMVHTGRTAEAQAFILGELEKRYGGAAAAAAKMGLGPLKMLANRFGDVKEQIGELILRGINKLMPVLNFLTEGFGKVVHVLKENPIILKALAVGLGVAAVAAAAFAIQAWAVNAALFANPIVWIIAGIAALAAAMYYLYQRFEIVRQIVHVLYVGPIKFLIELFTVFAYAIVFVTQKIVEFIRNSEFLQLVWQGLVTLFKYAWEAMKSLGEGIMWVYEHTLKPFFNLLSKSWAAWKQVLGIKGGLTITNETEEADAMPSFADMLGIPGAGGAGGDGDLGSGVGKSQGTVATQVTINIDNLVREFTISTQNTMEAASKVKEMITAALIEAVNDSQIVAGR